MLKRESKPIKEKNCSVVLFLRIEQAETAQEKEAAKYTLHLDVKSSVELPIKRESEPGPIVVKVGDKLTKTLHQFSYFRKRPSHIRIFGVAESLKQLMEMEKTIGVEIHQTFFSGIIGKTFEDLLNLLHRRKMYRLTLVISSRIPEILDIPFEMMRNDSLAEPVLLFYNDFHLVHSIETTLEQFQVSGFMPLAPPLRMLFVAALPVDLPEEQRVLELEKEQELLIEALGPLITEKKVLVEFLDIATLEEIEKSLKVGEHHIVHFSGHGVNLDFSQQKGGILYLEDEEGNTVKVTGKELAQRLKSYSSIRLVVISACESAYSEDYGVAGALINGGIPTVLGMRYQVSDEKALRFTSRLYADICSGKSLSHAMFNARKAIYDYEKEKIADLQKNKAKSMVFLEWMTPFLYQNQNILHLIDYSKESTDTRYFFQKPISLVQGGKYVGRGFIGRRREIIKLHRLLREGKRSVCIYGQGGIGKTTLAIRFADNYENGAYKIIQFRNEISEETILTRLAKVASRYMGEEIIEFIQSPDIDSIDKLNVLIEQFLSRHKIIILFDDFEENLRKSKRKKIYQRKIRSSRLKSFLIHLCQNLTRFSYILFTTRYLFTEPETATLNLGEMGLSDTFKLLSRYENLVQLPMDQKRFVHDSLGGHPHALALFDKYIGIQGISWKSIIQKFQEVEDREINHDLLLDMLWEQLTLEEQKTLMGVSIFRGLTAKEGALAVTGQNKKILKKSIESLNALSLLYVENDKLNAHRLTAIFVQSTKMDKNQLIDYHSRAARYFECSKDEEGKWINNYLEARWHYFEAGQWDWGAEITFDIETYLTLHGYPHYSFELLEELGDKEINQKNRSIYYHRRGMLCQHFGDYNLALKHYQKSWQIRKQVNDTKGIAASLHQIGRIYQEKSDYDAALKKYQESLEIRENIDDIKGRAHSLHQIGIIYQLKGDYDSALSYIQKSLEIKEKIGDIRGVANSVQQIGKIYHEKCDYDTAVSHYQKSLEIKEKIGDIKGISYTSGQIGRIYQDKNDYNAALEQYQKVLETSERIGDIKSVSICLHNIAMLFQYKSDYDSALKYFQKSLEIKEKIGDMNGYSNSLHQIGLIYQHKGNYDAALKQYQRCLEIKEKVGDKKGLAVGLHQIAVIYQYKGDYDAALKQYRKSMEIKEKIGDIKGVSRSLGQIGRIFHHRGDWDAALMHYQKSLGIKEKIGDLKGIPASLGLIGSVYQEKGDYDAALERYQKSLQIKEKIGDIKGVSKSLSNIGMLYHCKNEYDEALRYYRKSLEIREKIGDVKGISETLHRLGMTYQRKGDYNEALKNYQKALKISERSGDIVSAASTYGQLGIIYFDRKDYPISLEYYIKAFLVFSKTGSPKLHMCEEGILDIREKMDEVRFKDILGKHGIPIDTFE